MPLSKIDVLGYRGFKELGTIEFAIPNGINGSGLTIITGPNNSGKSSILECLRARSGYKPPSFSTGVRNSTPQAVDIRFHIDGGIETIKSITRGSSETIIENKHDNFHIFVLSSRRAFSPYFGRSRWSRKDYLNNNSLPAQRSATLESFPNRLFKILEDPKNFNLLLNDALGFIPEWTIDMSDQGQYFLKFFNGASHHSSDGMGEGIVSIFSILDSLYDSSPGDVIAIDEPELSLHPSLQKRVCSLLVRFSADRQIIVSTHSPYFVDLESIAHGGNLSRVITGEDGTKIHQLSAKSKVAISKLSSGNIKNPHVLGLDAKEIFFQEEKIILTEGQEDVLLYPEIARQSQSIVDGNFFGWGAGGAGNIKHLCRILSDLGFIKVAALLDGDKSLEKKSLEKEFQNYFFECIPAKDIRTKAAEPARDKVDGLLGENKTIKEEYKQPVSDIFSRLNSHMSS